MVPRLVASVVGFLLHGGSFVLISFGFAPMQISMRRAMIPPRRGIDHSFVTFLSNSNVQLLFNWLVSPGVDH